MKKLTILMAVAAVVCISVPAMAVDWNFYGSARMATYYISQDEKDVGTKSTDLQWELQPNSRIGANVKADHIKGQFEFATKASDNSDGGDGSVDTRRIWGSWNFGAGELLVGKDYSPVSIFVSAQAYDVDSGLIGWGAPYGGRPGLIQLKFGGFKVAAVSPKINADLEDTSTGSTGQIADGDPKRVIPKIEASYGMAFDAWNFDVFGGYQYYTIQDVTSLKNGQQNDVDVNSYIVGVSGMFNFGPAYVGAQFMYGQNFGNARWSGDYNGYSTAGWDGDDSTNDVTTMGGIFVAGMKVSDMLSFEAGVGYIQADPEDADNGFDEKTKAYDVYGQATIALAPGVFLIPSVGYREFGNTPEDEDQGNQFYLGAKWQIDF